MSQTIIGRSEEQKLLTQVLQSNEAEFVAVYGRRRVGKTYLIREFFAKRAIYLEATGMKNAALQQQLQHLTQAISRVFFDNIPLKVHSSWLEVLDLLTQQIERQPKNQKIVVFFDELPWMATKRSNLLQAIDHFWNTRWSRLTNLKFIVCGSAASWILDKLVNAKAGLYNRLTHSLLLRPFSLKDIEHFLLATNARLRRKQIIDITMLTGGIPYYLKQINAKQSTAENINRLCFSKDGLLLTEFNRLFKALFDESETNLNIIKLIAQRTQGLSRQMLIKQAHIASGGTLNKRIVELEASGFIQSFIPYGKKRDVYYRVTDEYSLFYLQWIHPLLEAGLTPTEGYWQSKIHSPAWYSWTGYAFENICLKHIEPIRTTLNLQHTGCVTGSWRYVPKKGSKKQGAQIDLLFDRDDNAITLCEIKYSNTQFIIDKAYGKQLLQKIDVFQEQTQKQLFLAMITTMGIKKNLWSEELIQAEVTLDDLFL